MREGLQELMPLSEDRPCAVNGFLLKYIEEILRVLMLAADLLLRWCPSAILEPCRT